MSRSIANAVLKGLNYELEITNNWMKFNSLFLSRFKSSYFIVSPHFNNSASALNNFSVKVYALKFLLQSPKIFRNNYR